MPTDVTRRADTEALRDRALDLDEMMTINVKSVLYGVQAVLPHFRDRQRGHLIAVSSMLGRMPLFHMRSAYSAAKAALDSLMTSLRLELRAEWPAIHVSTVLPGIVATDFGVNARHGGPDSRQLPGGQTPEEVAAMIADLIEKPQAELYTRPAMRAFAGAYYSAEDVTAVEAQPLFR